MHPRVAARIGIKLLAIFVFASALPSAAAMVWQAVMYWNSITMPGVRGPTSVEWWFRIITIGAPLIQIAFAAFLYYRADAFAKRIAPPLGRLCGDCGYDLKGVKGDACPECGAPAKRPGAAA